MRGDTLLECADKLKDIATQVESTLIQDTEGRAGHSEVILELQTLHERLVDLTQKLDRRDDDVGRDIMNIGSTLAELSDLLNKNHQSTTHVERQLGAVISSSGSDGATTGRRGRTNTNIPGVGSQNTDRLVSVHTTLNFGRRCHPSCNCQCHKKSAFGSPEVVSRILGRLLLAWSVAPLCRTRACDHPKCKHNSPNIVRLTYVFPQWMSQRELALSLSWGSVVGTGADIHLAIPRVLSTAHISWRAIEQDDVPLLEGLISRKEITLTEVNEYGNSLLMVSHFPRPRLRLAERPFSLQSRTIPTKQLL